MKGSLDVIKRNFDEIAREPFRTEIPEGETSKPRFCYQLAHLRRLSPSEPPRASTPPARASPRAYKVPTSPCWRTSVTSTVETLGRKTLGT
jgi:hypothetical protein